MEAYSSFDWTNVVTMNVFVLQCNRANMETLTLGRYVLEMSLMEYEFVHRSESQMAAAALYLALRMKNICDWVRLDRFRLSLTSEISV